MLEKFRPRSAYDVMAALALVAAIAGGTAYAAAKIGSGDIKRNAIKSSHIQNGKVTRGDLNPLARAKRIDYQSSGGPKTELITFGDLQLSADCVTGAGFTDMAVYVENVGTGVAGVDAAYLVVDPVGADPNPAAWGKALNPGDEGTISDGLSTFSAGPGQLVTGDGQIVVRTQGRVTTVTFHAGLGGGASGFCQLSGTAVFADS
jgi:hypothetical protein